MLFGEARAQPPIVAAERAGRRTATGMKKKRTTVWVVMHYEYSRLKGELLVDCLQFHVSSTRKKAEEFIRRTWVSSYSWWQIPPHVVGKERKGGKRMKREKEKVPGTNGTSTSSSL